MAGAGTRDETVDERLKLLKRIAGEIWNDIDEHSQESIKKAQKFICPYDLKRHVWYTHQNRVAELLGGQNINADTLYIIQTQMLIILSTLVYIRAFECLGQFQEKLFEPNCGKPKFRDSDLPLDKKQIALFLEDIWDRNSFYEKQHFFTPHIIDCGSTQVKQMDRLKPLPFSRVRKLKEGSYGIVELVEIAPRCFKEKKGATYEEPYRVACKKFRLRHDGEGERNRLQILKDSITTQRHILKHLATINHDEDLYILFPWAKHGDLSQFLENSQNIAETARSSLSPPQLFRQLLQQCYALADAFHWLHSGFIVANTTKRVACAHMDLKPDNILICEDRGSSVGRWVISDFGISVIKEQEVHEDLPIGSIRDFHKQWTINTAPKQGKSTYQAPEVSSSDTHDPKEKVGRQSDIWSYGCVLSEVLAWALDGPEGVENFTSIRGIGHKDDLFYEEKQQDRLALSGPKVYRVRRTVDAWLESIEQSPGLVLARCWANAIRSILIIDPNQRPDSKQVEDSLQHVLTHLGSSEHRLSLSCPLSRAAIDRGPTTPQRHHFQAENQPIFQEGQITVRNKPSVTIEPPESSNAGPGSSSGASDRRSQSVSETGSITSKSSNRSLTPKTGFPPVKLNTLPSNAHSVSLNPGPGIERETDLSFKMQIQTNGSHKVALAMNNDQIFAAFLRDSGVSVFEVNLHKSDWRHLGTLTFSLHKGSNCVIQNAGISMAGSYLAYWGYCSVDKTRQLYCGRITEQTHFATPRREPVEVLKAAEVSAHGLLALIYSNRILINHIIPNGSNSSSIILEPHPNYQQEFSTAIFNDDGSLLFAWAKGGKGTPQGGMQSLYVWASGGKVNKTQWAYEKHFELEGEPIPTMLIPYNRHPGCILANIDQQDFIPVLPKQDDAVLYNRHTSGLTGVITGCVFEDRSFLALTKKTLERHARLREFQIRYAKDGEHYIANHCSQKIILSSTSVKHSAMKAFRMATSEDVVVVCNCDGSIEVVRFRQASGLHGHVNR